MTVFLIASSRVVAEKAPVGEAGSLKSLGFFGVKAC